MSSSIPIDFTTQGSAVAPSASGAKCSCGRKLTGECNCERVRPISFLLTSSLLLKTPSALAERKLRDSVTVNVHKSRTNLSKERQLARADYAPPVPVLALMYVSAYVMLIVRHL